MDLWRDLGLREGALVERARSRRFRSLEEALIARELAHGADLGAGVWKSIAVWAIATRGKLHFLGKKNRKAQRF
jgi:hypothetical protein